MPADRRLPVVVSGGDREDGGGRGRIGGDLGDDGARLRVGASAVAGLAVVELELAVVELAVVGQAWERMGPRRAENFRAVAYPTARGCAAAYFPETSVLVPLDSTAARSNTPTSKSLVIWLEPASATRGETPGWDERPHGAG
nr:hypothetical protein [Frankia sp. QA3]